MLASLLILFIPQSVNRLLLVVTGCFLSLVGAFLTGPSKIFGLPNEIGLITAGMIISGLAKALMQSYAMTYIIASAQDAFSLRKEEVERKVPLMMTVSFGVGAFLIPIAMSAIYKVIHFRSTMDLLGALFSVNAVAFTIHASKKSCGRKP